MGMKQNNPGCNCCGSFTPCGPNQVICTSYSPNKKVRWVDVEISGIPDTFDAEVERTGVGGSRHELEMSGLSALNGTYRNTFDEVLCQWDSPVFDYTVNAKCTQYQANTPPGPFCNATSFPFLLFDSTLTARIVVFGGGAVSSETLGAPCSADWPGFSFAPPGSFDICDPTQQTFLQAVDYTQCAGSIAVNLSYNVTIKLTPSLIDV